MSSAAPYPHTPAPEHTAQWEHKLQQRLGMSSEELYQGICRLISRQAASDRQDLAQEIFLQVLLSLDQYRQDGPPEAWVNAIARHHISRYYRRQRRARSSGELPLEDDTTAVFVVEGSRSPEQQLQERQFIALVDEALSAQSDRTRQALWMTEVEGSSCQDAGEALGLDPQHVRNRKSDLRKLLRRDEALWRAVPSHWGEFGKMLGIAGGLLCVLVVLAVLILILNVVGRSPAPEAESFAQQPARAALRVGGSRSPAPPVIPAGDDPEQLYRRGLFSEAKARCDQSEALGSTSICMLATLETLVAARAPFSERQCAQLSAWAKPEVLFDYKLRAARLYRIGCKPPEVSAPPKRLSPSEFAALEDVLKGKSLDIWGDKPRPTPAPTPDPAPWSASERDRQEAFSAVFNGAPKRAIKLCEPIAEQEPECYRIMGLAYTKLHDRKRACVSFQAALDHKLNGADAIKRQMQKIGCDKKL